ncbi:hypothetical protein [Pseudoneobacillus sp. C159]
MEFLFDNPIILIVIIGMIVSYVKRLKGNPNGEQSTKEKADWKKLFDLPEITKVDLPKNEGKIIQPEVLTRDNLELTKPPSKSEPNSDITSREIVNMIAEGEIKDEIGLTPNKQQLINGIVWSEILGPPRARKTHSKARR